MSLDDEVFDRLVDSHTAWWRDFWKKSNVTFSDELLELHWYSGLYTLACCMGNDKFPPGLWGNFATQDGMQWQGDYHMNYNFEAPYYPVAASNHPEFIKGYMAALNDFIPKGRRYAREYLGCRGVYFPVGIGPLGHETDIWPTTKEHGHLFLGQKSHAAYGAVIPMMHWYSTRDADFAKKYYYNYLREVGLFWEDYLVEYNGNYHIRNDALFEAGFWNGMTPKGHDAVNPIISLGLVKMLMKLLCDIATELDVDKECIPKWVDIAQRIAEPETYEEDGVTLLRGRSCDNTLFRQVLEYIYPADGTGMYENPRLMQAAKNSLEKLDSWDHPNIFCSYYPAAVILGVDYDTLATYMKDCIEKHHLGNGLFRFEGGGLENSAAILSTVNEMLLGSRDGVIKLFPCMKHDQSASFNGLRAYGAFVVNASLEDGVIKAEILSEKGQKLKLEKPGAGYVLIYRNKEISLCDNVTEVETMFGEKLYVRKK